MTTDTNQPADAETPAANTSHELIVAEAFRRLVAASHAEIVQNQGVNLAQLRLDVNVMLARLAGCESLLTALNPDFARDLNSRTAVYANTFAEEIEKRLVQPKILGANGIVMKSNLIKKAGAVNTGLSCMCESCQLTDFRVPFYLPESRCPQC